MLLVRCKDAVGETVLTAERYSWNFLRFREEKELPQDVQGMPGDFNGFGIGVLTPTGWENVIVGPTGYRQVIIEDERRQTRDNFRLKVYDEELGLVTYHVPKVVGEPLTR